MDKHTLIDSAYAAMEKSYSPYSHFKVGAALVAEDGSIYTGCNIENASYGAAICAERTAMVKAVSEGHTSFKCIAIVSSSREKTLPCGICRQFLSEFASEDAVVIMHDINEGIIEMPFSKIYPEPFSKDSIK
ncbi:MAG: cytidine deaminase [Lachnospiraceae bacterium]|nr:cytidine deaminase [Lachnospiraceae bacterium]